MNKRTTQYSQPMGWIEAVALCIGGSWILSPERVEGNIAECELAMRELGALELIGDFPRIEGAQKCSRMFALRADDGTPTIHVVWIEPKGRLS